MSDIETINDMADAIIKLESENKRLSEEHKQCHEWNMKLLGERSKYREALEKMGCSELLNCEQPITTDSKHSRNCNWEIAKSALDGGTK